MGELQVMIEEGNVRGGVVEVKLVMFHNMNFVTKSVIVNRSIKKTNKTFNNEGKA